MTNLSNAQNSSPNFLNIPAPIAERRDQKEKERAVFANLMSTLLAVLKTIPEGSASKESASKEQPPSIPSNYQMQQAIGELMSLLTNLQGLIAKLGTLNSQANSTVGQALVTEMQDQVKKNMEQLQENADKQTQQDFWSTFTKVAEGVVGAIVTGIAIICCQPALAIITLTFTVLTLSGGMDKITKGLTDVLISMGVPPETAKVLADVIIVVATIVATVATCGIADAVVGEELAGEAAEGGTEAGGEAAGGGPGAAGDAAEGGPEAAEEASESFAQKAENFFKNVENKIKEKNPFSKLSKNWNLGIVAGAQAIGSTGFGQDFMASVLVNMSDKEEKQRLETIFGIIINLLAAIAGGAAGAAVTMGPSFYSFSNTFKPLLVLSGLQIAGGVTQFSGEVGLGVTYGELAGNIDAQGQTKALLSILQALVRMNSGQADADAKSLGSKMKTWGSEIAALSHNLNAAEAAVARELQA